MSTKDTTKWSPLAFRLAPWIGFIAIIVLVVISTTHWRYWTSNRTIQTTQNAFVKSDSAILSTKISGYIQALPIGDYQTVQAGDLIAQIDDTDIRFKVSLKEATRSKAQANLDNLNNEIAQQRARIEQAKAKAQAIKIRADQYRTSPERQLELVGAGAVSQFVFDQAQADFKHAESQYNEALAELKLANASLHTLQGNRSFRQAELEAATTDLQAAQHELSYTKIVAPFNGIIGKKQVQLGSLVSTGTQLVSLVPTTRPYVIANYKETQLAHIKTGLPVELSVDAFPRQRFYGRVAKVAPMSGAETALLPIDNATGNFTKVVQRIPIRIELNPDQEAIFKLRPGMSVKVDINTEGELIPPYSFRSIDIVQIESDSQ